MKNTYCLTYQFPRETSSKLDKVMGSVKERLNFAAIDYVEPKLGSHLTIIPPFVAEHYQINTLVIGISMVRVLEHANSMKYNVFCVSQNDFINENKKSLILKIQAPEELIESVNLWRGFFIKEWDPVRNARPFNPHITVAEIDDTPQNSRKIDELGGAINFEPFAISLPSLSVMRKGSRQGKIVWWEVNQNNWETVLDN